MNTRLGKSFGLAFVVAVGILAVMFAMGTFNAQKAAAEVQGTVALVTKPATPGPGDNVQIELSFTNGISPITNFQEIEVELSGFGLPDSIELKDVQVRSGTSAGNPTNVRMDGDSIFIEVDGFEDDESGIAASDSATIVIRSSAGVTAPTAADDYTIEVDGNAATPDVTISATLELDPDEGSSSTEITVSGKAFADGTGTLSTRPRGVAVADATDLMDVMVDDGAFSATVDAGDLETDVNGDSLISIRDSDGVTAELTFTVTGTTTLGSDSVGKGKLLEITISDWIENDPAEVRIDGVVHDELLDENGDDYTVALTDGGDTFYVKVDGAVGLGTKTVVLYDSANARLDSATIEITALPLSVTPGIAVAGQEVTVEGTGFSTADGNQLATLTVGGIGQADLSNRNDVDEYDVLSGGRIVVTFAVPDEVTDGSQTIQVTDDEGRVGEVELIVPEPTIVLDPASSRRATTVNVDGSGFPADSNIIVDFGDDEEGVASGRTDNTGNFTASFAIPSDAGIGDEEPVTASITVDDGPGDADTDDTTYSAEATHTVPNKEITVSPDVVSSGEMITITGTGFPRYSDVEVLFGDGEYKTTDASTDSIGDFTVSVVVPGMDPGTHVVQVQADDASSSWVITVPDAPIIRTWPSADAFASLITAGNLTVVWNFDNATKAWSFYDPRPAVAGAVDLNEVSSGNNVWIRVTADQMFQGDMLTAGWNLVTLD